MSVDRLRPLLDGVRRRWRTHGGLRLAGRAAVAASVPILLAAAIGTFTNLSDSALAWLAVVTIVTAGAAVALVSRRIGVSPVSGAISDARLARFIEERAVTLAPGDAAVSGLAFDDVLVSAVEEGPAAPDRFRALVVESAARRLEAVGVDRIVPSRSIRLAALEALGGAAVLGLSIVLAAPLAGRVLDSAWLALFPGSVEPRDSTGRRARRGRSTVHDPGGRAREEPYVDAVRSEAHGRRRRRRAIRADGAGR